MRYFDLAKLETRWQIIKSGFFYSSYITTPKKVYFKSLKHFERELNDRWGRYSIPTLANTHQIVYSIPRYYTMFVFTYIKRVIKRTIYALTWETGIDKYINENKKRLTCQEAEIQKHLDGKLQYEDMHCTLQHEQDVPKDLQSVLQKAFEQVPKDS